MEGWAETGVESVETGIDRIRRELARRELARRHYGDYLAYVNGPGWVRSRFSEYLAGEKVSKRASAMEPGLRFRPLALPEQADLLCDLVSACWDGPFDRERLLSDAAVRPTHIGYLRDTPVGVIQTGPEPDRISLLCIHPEYRKRGFGVQLLGQAVYAAREQGFHQVWGPAPRSGTGESFARDYGFVPAGETAEGCPILRKDTGFDPEIWGTDH